VNCRHGLLAIVGLVMSASVNAGNPERGETLFETRCGACHAIEENGAGPKQKGLFGCVAGTQPAYEYSTALAASGLVWDEQTLNRWLENPSALVPGNKMVVRLADNAQDRADLIAYLRIATRDPGECRSP
jgi:cytochrome c